MLFLGDAEVDEESGLDVGGPVTLLQVGHHGSDTSTGDALLRVARPRYAVVSSAKRDEGTNKGYCHPRVSTVERLDAVLGGGGGAAGMVVAFDAAVKCSDARDSNWRGVATSERLWFTARDGDVVLVTMGDGRFRGWRRGRVDGELRRYRFPGDPEARSATGLSTSFGSTLGLLGHTGRTSSRIGA